MPSEVGVSEADLDAQRAFVKALDGKLDAAVRKCFAGDAPTLAQWNELHGRVQEYLTGWTLFVFTPMYYGVGQNLIPQLAPWVDKVSAAGCPVDAPGPAPTPTPGMLEQLASFAPASLEQAVFFAGVLWWMSKKLR